MAASTTTYSFDKPTVGGDTNTWGGFLNGNWDAVDGLLDGTTPVTGIDIDNGSIDGTPVGGSTPAAGAFTTLSSSGAATLNSVVTSSADINGGAIDGTPIGGSTPAAGAFTTLSASGATSVAALSASGVLSVASDIQHVGDANNKIAFGTDTQSFETGGSSRLDLSDSGVRLGGSGARVTTVLDEDAMGSDSATALATQQSIKAYVDAAVGSGPSTTAGAVGTYAFATRTTGTADVAFGDTLAGSSLKPTCAVFGYNDNGPATSDTFSFEVDSVLSGTWQCMGYYDHTRAVVGTGTNPTYNSATLWLRIS